MSTKEILIAARAKVAQGWTQGGYARTAEGVSCRSRSENAARWCAVGACYSVGGSAVGEKALDCLKGVIGGGLVIDWNDAEGRTQAEVLAAFDKAIEACQ